MNVKFIYLCSITRHSPKLRLCSGDEKCKEAVLILAGRSEENHEKRLRLACVRAEVRAQDLVTGSSRTLPLQSVQEIVCVLDVLSSSIG